MKPPPAHEELGLEVQVGRLLGTATGAEGSQAYFEATLVSGQFGTGYGEELASLPTSDRGSYEPVWMLRDDLRRHHVRPWDLAEMIADDRLPDCPVDFVG